MPPTYKYMANVLREELTKCGKDNQQLEARVVQLEEALRFYANRKTWEWKLEEFPGAKGMMHRTSIAEKDDGKKARAALSSEAAASEAPEKEGEDG